MKDKNKTETTIIKKLFDLAVTEKFFGAGGIENFWQVIILEEGKVKEVSNFESEEEATIYYVIQLEKNKISEEEILLVKKYIYSC